MKIALKGGYRELQGATREACHKSGLPKKGARVFKQKCLNFLTKESELAQTNDCMFPACSTLSAMEGFNWVSATATFVLLDANS